MGATARDQRLLGHGSASGRLADDESLVVTLNEDSVDDGEAALGQTFEFSVPLSVRGLEAGSLVKFFVEAFSHGQSSDRVPRETTLEFTVPPPDFEHLMWQV